MQLRGPARGVAVDVGVFALGATLTTWLALPWLGDPRGLSAAYVMVALSVVLLAQFPIELATRAGEVVIGFEAAALVFLALVTPRSQALALWLVAMVIAHGRLPRKRWNDRLFNIGCTCASGVVAVLFIEHAQGRGAAAHLLWLSLGCGAYFVADMLLTAISLAATEAVSLREALPVRSAVMPLVSFIGVDTLGYLAALLFRAYPAWSLLLLLVPLATILVAARAVTRARVSERRSAGLFEIARAATRSESGDIVDLVVTRLGEMLPNRTVTSSSHPPRDGVELGGALSLGPDEAAYIVVGRGRAGPAFRVDERETVATLVSVAADALERQRLVAEMTWLARFDPLTSLVNRTVFVDRLEHALHRVRRGNDLLAVLYCDLDGFKRVNDRLGHAAGDAVLREAATRLNATLRSADTAARFGGDEFAILAEDLHDEREATLLADRVVAALAAPFTVSGSRIDLGVSVGVATTRGDADAEPLLRDADMAMYRAKSLGRGRVELFDPKMRADNDYRVRLEDALRGSLDDGTLSLAYQPVVDLGSGRVDGFEALLRWTHPSLGAVPPDVLLPVAEASGLMPRLGRWVIAEAHRAGVALADAAGRPITMAVNMAAEQLRDEEFLTLAAGLASDPRVNLVLELTERALVEEAAAGDAMRRLAAAGAKLAIDDFGIGYSSISYLHQFDCIDIVKIDRSFVLSVDDPRTAALVRSIIAMADAFGTAVVAEGVEDLRNCAALAAAGCALAQGFLFSPAVPADAAAELVQDRSGFAPLLAESHRHQRTTPASRH